MEWEFLEQFRWGPPASRHQLPRRPEVQAAYEQFQRTHNMPATIMQEVFVAPATVLRGWTLVPNKFPYAVAPGIEHWVLWLHPRKAWRDVEVLEFMIHWMRVYGFQAQNVIFFRIRPEHQSVKGIPHYHVFLRR